jgi:hypothetical protein
LRLLAWSLLQEGNIDAGLQLCRSAAKLKRRFTHLGPVTK